MKSRIHEIKEILNQYRNGLLSKSETYSALDLYKIRGEFNSVGLFCGYDYKEQRWIDEITK